MKILKFTAIGPVKSPPHSVYSNKVVFCPLWEEFCVFLLLLHDSHKYDYDKISPEKPPQSFEIAFTTTDMEKTLNKAIKAGATKVTDPIEKPWGQIICYIRDPEGFLIEIVKEPSKWNFLFDPIFDTNAIQIFSELMILKMLKKQVLLPF